ncbi:MAG TPA: c-type cytochrome [Gaiellales bacterium]|nr:c-type cytochrome [Gaiellales bacterium]
MIRLVPAALAAACLAVAAGCGGPGVAAPGSADLSTGKQIFQQKCGYCHTLAEAATSGTIGPNLDDAYFASRLDGLQSSSFEALVRNQISEPNPEGKMPANLVGGQQAQDVAAYVASVAGLRMARQLNPGTQPG